MFFILTDWFLVCFLEAMGFLRGASESVVYERRDRGREGKGLVGIQQGPLTPHPSLFTQSSSSFCFLCIGIPSKHSHGWERGG